MMKFLVKTSSFKTEDVMLVSLVQVLQVKMMAKVCATNNTKFSRDVESTYLL